MKNLNISKESIALGVAAAASAALTGIAGYQVGMRRTRKLYEAQINVLTAMHMKDIGDSMVSAATSATTVEVVPEAQLATDMGNQTDKADLETLPPMAEPLTPAIPTVPTVPTVSEVVAPSIVKEPRKKTPAKDKRKKDAALMAAMKNPLGQPELEDSI